MTFGAGCRMLIVVPSCGNAIPLPMTFNQRELCPITGS